MLNRNDLPIHTIERLNQILSMSPEALNSDHVAFLKARIDYLSKEEIVKFIPVVQEEIEMTKTEMVKILEEKGIEVDKKLNKEQIKELFDQNQ